MNTIDYSAYVWLAFLFACIVLGALTFQSIAQLRKKQQELRILQQDFDSDE